MGDLVYINFLRERVRQAEAKEAQSLGTMSSSSSRFVPCTIPPRSADPSEAQRDTAV
jgi:hypothetical protein